MESSEYNYMHFSMIKCLNIIKDFIKRIVCQMNGIYEMNIVGKYEMHLSNANKPNI